MIGGESTVARGQNRTLEVAQLFGMKLDRHAKRGSAFKKTADLRRYKPDPLAEAIDSIDQPFSMRLFKPGNGHFVDIAICLASILGRERMRGEPCSADAHRPVALDLARDAQHAHLVLDSEAIARLDLDHTDPVGHQVIDAAQGGPEQLLVARCARGLDRGYYAPARTSDLLIARAAQPQREFVAAISSENQMCMAIDERGRDQRAAKI